jgi:DNA polymerase-3 subunit epsilon
MSKGFAVVGLETTGMFPTKHDRIVEVGVVLVSPDGEIESRHETLVNPMRDMGPQHIHGISAAAAAKAPIFEQIPIARIGLSTGVWPGPSSPAN